jgi:DNA-binding GntR family transcriptional regulator
MPTFDRAPSLTITDYLVQVIGRKILSGELKPGERLHETVIAQEVGVSRGPIREAVRRLQEQGLLTYAPNRGVWVTELSIDDVEALLDIRAALEGIAARRAVPHLDDDLFKALSLIIEQMKDSGKRGATNDLVYQDVEFHRILSEASSNQRLVQMIEQMSIQTRPHMAASYVLNENLTTIAAIHQELLGVLQRRDPDEIEKTIRDHIYTFGRLFIDRLQQERQKSQE